MELYSLRELQATNEKTKKRIVAKLPTEGLLNFIQVRVLVDAIDYRRKLRNIANPVKQGYAQPRASGNFRAASPLSFF
jgi:hypothetical protein